MIKSLLRHSTIIVVASFFAVVACIVGSTGVSAQDQSSPALQPQNAAPTSGVSNNVANNICRGVLSTTGDSGPGTTIDSCQESGDGSFSFLIRRIINLFSVVVGAVSVIMIIIGGFRYIISGGDSGSVSGAKNTILYAIVGLVIVVFAQVIVRFVLTNVSPIAG